VQIQANIKHLTTLTLTRATIKTILSKGHNEVVSRNKYVIDIKNKIKQAEYFGWAEDERINGIQKHPDVNYWLYYKTEVGYLCIKRTKVDGDKPYAIVDNKDFSKIKGIKKEDPIR
jgi:hypothetical protein